jgi:hypothetical protein
MKTLLDFKTNRINLLFLILIVIVVISTCANRANAQGFGRGSSSLFVALEATNSNRTFGINSDLQDLKGAKVIQHGRTYGIVVGNRLVSGKMRLGSFSGQSGDSKPIQSNAFELGSNFNPLQLFASKSRFLEPYIIVSMETTKIKSEGTFIPPPVKAASAPAPSTCTCTCPSAGAQLDPDAAAAPTPVPYSGKFGSTRANVGVGLKAHIQKGKVFINLFGEMNYGLTLGTTASTQALLNTYVLNQVAFNMGASIGLTHKKPSVHRLRNISFR